MEKCREHSPYMVYKPEIVCQHKLRNKRNCAVDWGVEHEVMTVDKDMLDQIETYNVNYEIQQDKNSFFPFR